MLCGGPKPVPTDGHIRPPADNGRKRPVGGGGDGGGHPEIRTIRPLFLRTILRHHDVVTVCVCVVCVFCICFFFGLLHILPTGCPAVRPRALAWSWSTNDQTEKSERKNTKKTEANKKPSHHPPTTTTTAAIEGSKKEKNISCT